MKKERGSITLFSLLALLLTTATIFALLEGTRLQEMRRFASLQTEVALESCFANYNTCLWENYHLLGADGLSMQEILVRGANGRVGTGTNLLRLKSEEVEWKEITRLTDGEGIVYIKNVASYMKENFVYEVAKATYSNFEAISEILDSGQLDLANITEALKELEQIKEEAVPQSVGLSGSGKGILESAKEWMDSGILELVLPDTQEVSIGKEEFENGLLERKLEEGNSMEETAITWADRILLQQYLLTYMSNFVEQKGERALTYEIEYLLGKRNTDIENLEITVTKLMLIREACNFLYLLSSPTRMAQAEALAVLLIGASTNPVLIEAVKIGILTAWALGESILDVRALLGGKKILLIKNEDSWTLELDKIAMLSDTDSNAKDCAMGFGYETYLGILLLFEKEQTLAMHAMNLQEATIRKQTGELGFYLDGLITWAKAEVQYSYKPVFPFLQIIDAEERWRNIISATEEYGYY